MSPATDHHWRPARLLDDGRKLAGAAALAVLISFFLPWYEKSAIPPGATTFAHDTISAWGAFTWIEAAVLLVDAAVIALLWLRSTGRRVELPFGDGTAFALAGGWIVVLLLIRVFDKPEATGGTAASVGLQWGLLVAMASAGALLAAGLTARSIERHAAAAPDAPPPPPA